MTLRVYKKNKINIIHILNTVQCKKKSQQVQTDYKRFLFVCIEVSFYVLAT